VLCVGNLTPVPRQDYKVGVPDGAFWKEVLNSDSERYGGSNWGNLGGVEAIPYKIHRREWALDLALPPLSFMVFERA
jgi:1,4-alpha-glucan branching enzyme